MTLCFFLKILGELSLYFCIANAVLSIALTGVESVLPLFIVSLIAAVGHYIDEKHSKFRFFLLPLLLSVFFLGSGFAYYLAVGLPALYIALTSWDSVTMLTTIHRLTCSAQALLLSSASPSSLYWFLDWTTSYRLQ